MSAGATRIVNKLWSCCNVLRDDGLSYSVYLEQLTDLLFLKMADEQTGPPWKRPSPVPAGYDRPRLTPLDANLARCARLRQAILKRAFEGRLVPAEGEAPLLAAEPTSPFVTGSTP